MQVAIDACRDGIAHGQSPFGACIVKDDRAIVATCNHVWQHTDITAHAEVEAIRLACSHLHTVDLSGCTIYSTCEPCPMCFSAIHWARISRIVYGASIGDAAGAGFNELPVSNQVIKQLAKLDIELIPHILQSECVSLFEDWQKSDQARSY